MDAGNYAQFLEKHGVKATSNRIVVVKALAEAESPLSLSELEAKIITIDKSGVFRALTLFREHHIVHVIEDGGNGVKYELCRSNNHRHDDDTHPHFHCEICGRTFCIESESIPEICLPDGFVPRSTNYMVKGVCPKCSAKHH